MLLTFSVILQANFADKSEDIVVEMLIPKIRCILASLVPSEKQNAQRFLFILICFWLIWHPKCNRGMKIVIQGRQTHKFLCVFNIKTECSAVQILKCWCKKVARKRPARVTRVKMAKVSLIKSTQQAAVCQGEVLLMWRSVTVRGDSSQAVNLELWSGMLFMSELASSSSYERPLKEDGMLTKSLCTTVSPLCSLTVPGWAHSELCSFGLVVIIVPPFCLNVPPISYHVFPTPVILFLLFLQSMCVFPFFEIHLVNLEFFMQTNNCSLKRLKFWTSRGAKKSFLKTTPL